MDDNLVFKITKRATVQTVTEYFGRLWARIYEEQLTEIHIPGKDAEFFDTDEESGIEIDGELMSKISTNYRVKLPVKHESHDKFNNISVLNFTPRLVHQLEYELRRCGENFQVCQTKIGDKAVLVSVQKKQLAKDQPEQDVLEIAVINENNDIH